MSKLTFFAGEGEVESSQLSTCAGSLNPQEHPGVKEGISGEEQEKRKAERSGGCSLPDKFGQHL